MIYSDKVEFYLDNIYVHHEDIYRILKSTFNDNYIAEDLTQTVMMRAWRGLDNLREADKAKPWLKTITRNVIREYMRKKGEVVCVEDVELINAIDSREELNRLEHDVLEMITRNEAYAMIGCALKSLDEEYQMIIRKHLIGEITLKEISRRSGIKYGTVRVMYRRGLNMLKEAFLKLEEGGKLDG